MSHIMHFEISANNPEAQAAFYRAALGWQVTKWDGPQDYWFIKTGGDGEPGISGALFKPREPFIATVNIVAVGNLDATLERVQAAGGTVVVPKHAIPGMGFQAYCKDPEGVLFGVHQADPNASMG